MVAGRGPSPALVLALVEGLPEDSATVAAMRGGADWRGWTQQARILADVYDAINLNTRASGRWKKRAPKIDPYPRPKRARSRRRGQSISDIRRIVGAPVRLPNIPQPKT